MTEAVLSLRTYLKNSKAGDVGFMTAFVDDAARMEEDAEDLPISTRVQKSGGELEGGICADDTT